MTLRAMTIDDLAAELGRTREWLSDHWRRMVKEKKLPAPLLERGSPTWDRAQVYAVRDKALPPAARPMAAAFRAAMDAAHATPEDAAYHDEEAADRRRLDARFGGAGAVGTGQPKRHQDKEAAD
jgi:hypothetical protein